MGYIIRNIPLCDIGAFGWINENDLGDIARLIVGYIGNIRDINIFPRCIRNVFPVFLGAPMFTLNSNLVEPGDRLLALNKPDLVLA